MKEPDTGSSSGSYVTYAEGNYLEVLRTRNTFLEVIEDLNANDCVRRPSSDPISASVGSSGAAEGQPRDACVAGGLAPAQESCCTARSEVLRQTSPEAPPTAPPGNPSTVGKSSCRNAFSPNALTAPGDLPSQGSALHASGTCKPCLFHSTGKCANRSSCKFCHYQHEPGRTRPGKEKRRRAQKLVDYLEANCRTTSELAEFANKIESPYARDILMTKVKRLQDLVGPDGSIWLSL